MPAAGPGTAALLAALAEPRRAEIVRLLEQRQRTQRGLCADLGMSQPLVSHHLTVLESAGLVGHCVCGRRKVYALQPTTLTFLAERLAAAAARAAVVASRPPC